MRRFIPACAGNSSDYFAGAGLVAVHPRVCGEQGNAASVRRFRPGSSPRVRGTAQGHRRQLRILRFIPACAGNSGPQSPLIPPTTVHPRVCGEQPWSLAARTRARGSSPRVRGTGKRPTLVRVERRFIPACAGNSCGFCRFLVHTPVHPRVCGEQAIRSQVASSGFGSSPRVRGTAHAKPMTRYSKRFIPACAGNSRSRGLLFIRFAVHPRVCGEQVARQPHGPNSSGSSPRVRGTDSSSVTSVQTHWFIPACAGNRPRRTRWTFGWPVHPRVCGEQANKAGDLTYRAGSSPRVRGTASMSLSSDHHDRFIPACAGNSSRASRRRTACSVHPRVCGEQTS